MSDPISPEIRDNIDRLCRQVSVSHNLDDEIRKELRSHMEDKFRNYLIGNEQLTEDDAFILVREHFGNPSVIKALYQDVEVVATQVSLIRKLCAFISLSLGISIVFNIMSQMLTTYNIFVELPEKFVIFITGLILSLIILTSTLIIWRKKINNGQVVWFMKIKLLTFYSILLTLFVVFTFFRIPNYYFHLINDLLKYNFVSYAVVAFNFHMLLQFIICLVWCDIPHYVASTILHIGRKLKLSVATSR
ncbi:MAG: hypothetical protein JXB48_07990 [Candidatus Latescibacteria bacterium]|nr:hypothetical protein [Candidatus Latescibacterota bacterium]